VAFSDFWIRSIRFLALICLHRPSVSFLISTVFGLLQVRFALSLPSVTFTGARIRFAQFISFSLFSFIDLPSLFSAVFDDEQQISNCERVDNEEQTGNGEPIDDE
jgi:hypothetical protein